MSLFNKLVIREARSSDYIALRDFFERNNVAETIRQFHPFPLTAETAKSITSDPHLDRYYLAFVGDQVVGLCMLRGWDEGFTVPSFGILVDREFRGKHLGKVMTGYAIARAKELGCKRVRLSVYASNGVACRLYMSLGFKESSRETVEVEGEKDEKIIMFKEL